MVLSAVILGLVLPTQLVLSEIMANPTGGSGAYLPEDRNEFVEVYNTGREAIDLFNYTLSDGDAVDRIIAWQDTSILVNNPGVIINSTWLKPGGYAVILDPEYTDSAIGGYVQPYRFCDSTLILTVGNTTIGNGLANNDPLTLTSPYGDTTTFGTPYEPADGFPFNPGDGISWERINLNGSDVPENWSGCPDSAGCTPGMANAISRYFDLSIRLMAIKGAAPVKPESVFEVELLVLNSGYGTTPDWQLIAWWNGGDTFAWLLNPGLLPGEETSLVLKPVAPKNQTELWARIVCPEENETLNNSYRLLITPAGKRQLLSLGFSSFSPNDDGFEDSLPIYYFLPDSGGHLTVKLFNLRGRCVRNLYPGRHPTGTRGVIFWNGRDDANQRVATGIYAVYLEYRNSGKKITARLPAVVLR